MKKTVRAMGVLLILAIAAVGCKKKEENNDISGFARPTAENTARPKEKPAPVPSARALPKADSSVPLASYVKLEDGNQLMFMYYALIGGSMDYEKIAQQYSSEYRVVTDGFKKQDMLKTLQPRIDAGVEKAKAGRYFIYTYEVSLGSQVLNQYDFNSKSFPVDNSIWSPSAYSYFNDNPRYRFSFTNGEAFRELKVEDADIARKIEALVTGYKPIKAVVYAFAQAAEPVSDFDGGKILVQIVKMHFTDGKGKDLLAK